MLHILRCTYCICRVALWEGGRRQDPVATLFLAVNHSSDARAFTPVTLRPFRRVRLIEMNTCKVWGDIHVALGNVDPENVRVRLRRHLTFKQAIGRRIRFVHPYGLPDLDRAGVLTSHGLRLWFQQRIVSPRRSSFMGDAVSCVVLADGADSGLARAARRAAASHEALQVLRVDAPYRTNLDAKESLAGEQPAHIGR